MRPFAEKSIEDKIKDILVKEFSLHEVHSYIWEYSDEYKKLGIVTEPNVKLLNATNPNIETIRKSMIPTQLCQIKTNSSYAPSFGIFEIGRTVDGIDENNLCREHKKLAVTLFSKTETTETLYFKLIRMISVAVDDIKHKSLSFTAKETGLNYIHPKNFNAIVCDGKEIGEIGVVHPEVLKNIDKKANVVFLEVDMKDLVETENAGIKYAEASKYPSIEVDVTFVADTFRPIKEAIALINSELVKKTSVVDTYNDANGKSITIRIVFSHPERTLVKDEVMAIVNELIAKLESKGIKLKA